MTHDLPNFMMTKLRFPAVERKIEEQRPGATGKCCSKFFDVKENWIV